jgi:hypothetical protein
MEILCIFKTISIPNDPVTVWKDIISVLYGLKWCHEWKWGGFGMVL